jgi:pyridinium-3,5-bisthiocarboxylic acid mononucleotide nickel chelatase
MMIAWFHCFAGTAGDMTLGALIDAGADPVFVAEVLSGLDLDGYALTFEPVLRCGVAATHAVVVIDHDHSAEHDHDHDDHEHDHEHEHDHADDHDHGHRSYRLIRDLLVRSELPERVRRRALATFDALAEVEGAMHRMSPADVEFHEVGSLDAIIDIVGSCAAMESLGIDEIVCSPIAVGRGTVRAAHGELPNPAPAVTGLLARVNAPAAGIDTRKEIATPTGVALMTALASSFGPLPAMTVRSVGYGAGTADIPGRPNVVQVVIGQSSPAPLSDGQPVRLFEVNVDDITGEVVAHTIACLLDAGAFDAWATPIVMKKGRPAFVIQALCDLAVSDRVSQVLLAETGSLGLRASIYERWPQQRTGSSVELEGQTIAIKIAAGRIKVEHDDAQRAALALGWPLRAVLSAAETLGWAAVAEHEGNR